MKGRSGNASLDEMDDDQRPRQRMNFLGPRATKNNLNNIINSLIPGISASRTRSGNPPPPREDHTRYFSPNTTANGAEPRTSAHSPDTSSPYDQRPQVLMPCISPGRTAPTIRRYGEDTPTAVSRRHNGHSHPSFVPSHPSFRRLFPRHTI